MFLANNLGKSYATPPPKRPRLQSNPYIKPAQVVHITCAIFRLFEAICDTTTIQVVHRKFNRDFVSWQDFDVVHTHLSRNMSQYLVPIFEFYPKHCVWESLKDSSLKLNNVFFCQRLSSKQIEHFAAIVDITKDWRNVSRRILGTRNPNKPNGLVFAPACQACGLTAAQFATTNTRSGCSSNRQVFARLRYRLVGISKRRHTSNYHSC